MAKISFGTDGWRAIIGEAFTYDNLAIIAQATARWLRAQHDHTPEVLIGYDARFQGAAFARHAARALGSEGVRVVLSDAIVTTPAVSWATKHYALDAGIVVTASHNPPAYSGFKIKGPYGGPTTPEMIREVEEELDTIDRDAPLQSYEALDRDGLVELRDVRSAYLAELGELLDLDALKSWGQKVAHDAMFGAAQGHIAQLLSATQVVELHAEHNPGFHGVPPEPIEKHLSDLAQCVTEFGCAAGLANDGDGDRIGMFDEKGRFVSSHELLALLVQYLHNDRGLSGSIVKTFSTTHMLDKMADAYGLPIETTPIGFKYIAPKIIEGDVLVGGEESGGIAVKGHVPERDGIYIGLLIVEMMVKRGQPLSALVAALHEEFGPHRTFRIDLHTSEEKKQAALDRLEAEGGLDEIAGHAIRSLDTLDGFKHLADDGWLLVRPSGTEPVLRVYSEAPTAEAAEALVRDAIDQLGVG